MACGSCSRKNAPAAKWQHTSPTGVVTIKRYKHEVDWLLKRDGGSIEQVRV